MKHEIKIAYDGEYPCLCMGHLIVTIDDKEWDFGDYCLSSGGLCGFTEDYSESIVVEGDWSISKFPEGFPEELKELVTEMVNAEIPHGCCGGCL